MAPALNLGVEDLLELGLRGQGLAEPHDVLGETVGEGGPGVIGLRPQPNWREVLLLHASVT